jgi:hypothetical protein
VIFLIGFGENEVGLIKEALSGYKIYEIPEYCRDWVLQEIVDKAEKLEESGNWHWRKFLIMHNLENHEVKDVITKVKALKVGRVIFATTTPTSLMWRLEDLTNELIKEDEYFQQLQMIKKQKSRFYLDIGKG